MVKPLSTSGLQRLELKYRGCVVWACIVLLSMLINFFMISANPTLQKKLLLALKKAQGTLTKVSDMIEADEYC